ncbi:acyl carrier protein [Candidatus Oleimmundimicrobium sp.]|uniref:acyl carrier protein n=1 Tax=Candidatus Oleimmundimicrobium sp. TaxID=3060597 RepID=UPI002724F43C|nr:acyl carrier protein [Candidatus Oleimmundimicrobium sp.]MDO8886348.1 acyl carrier protein [Candidatus Oleimmundimicrobium sp.]
MGHMRHDSTTDFRARVLEILAAQALCAPADIAADATLESLGIDSLGQAEIIFAIEEQFDVTVPFNANTPQTSGIDLSTVAGIVAGVEALVRARRG